MMKNVFRYITVYVVLIAVFFGSLIVVSALPRLSLDDNVNASVRMLEKENLSDEQLYYTSKLSKLDNFTDMTMLNIAYHLTRVDVVKSALAGKMNFDLDNFFESLREESRLHSIQPNKNYSRYWHGYLVFLRPMLIFFNIGEIRLINSYIFVILLIVCLIMMYKKLDWKFSFAFLLSLLMVNLFIITVCMQFITIYYISIISCIILLSLPKTNDKNLSLWFFVLGALTMFFDFYTYPILAFGYPIACVLAKKYKSNTDYKISEAIKLTFKCLLTWLIGYLSVWIGKSILSYLFVGPDELNALLNAVTSRIARESNGLSGSALWLKAIGKSFGIYYYVPILILAFVLIILALFFRKKFSTQRFSISLLIISILPLIWLFAAANPLLTHYWFQARALGLSFFCWILVLLNLVDFKMAAEFFHKRKIIRQLRNGK